MSLDDELAATEEGFQAEAEAAEAETEVEDAPEAAEGVEDALGDDGAPECSAEPADDEKGLDVSEAGVSAEDSCGGEDAAEDAADEADDDFEVLEIEFDEADIVRYVHDEDGNDIGFVLIEDGKEVEYLYVDEDEDDATDAGADDEYDLGITREGVAQATNDMNAIYREGVQTVAELKGAFDDIKSALDFGPLFPKK